MFDYGPYLNFAEEQDPNEPTPVPKNYEIKVPSIGDADEWT